MFDSVLSTFRLRKRFYLQQSFSMARAFDPVPTNVSGAASVKPSAQEDSAFLISK